MPTAPNNELQPQNELDEKQKALSERSSQLAMQADKIKKSKHKNIFLLIINIILVIVFIIICTLSVYRRYDDAPKFEKPAETDEGQKPITDDTPQKEEKQTKTTDDKGNELTRDEYGFYVQTGDDGKIIRLDINGKKIPLDKNDAPIVYDEDGNRILLDDKGKLLVVDKDGNRIPIGDLWNYIEVNESGMAVVYISRYYKDKHPQETTEPPKSGDGHFTIYSVGDVYTAETGSGMLHCDIRNTEDSTHDIIVSIYISKDEMEAHGISTSGMDGDKWLLAQSGLFEPGYQINDIQLAQLPDGSWISAGSYSLTMNERYYDHENGVLSSYEANIPVTLEAAE